MTKIIALTVGALIGLVAMGAMSMADAQALRYRLCTGDSNLNYFKAGHMMKKRQPTGVIIEVVETKGSIDNLDKIAAGECDGAFVQNDALLVYSQKNAAAISGIERAGVLYREQVHMLCNRKANLGRMVNLDGKMRVAVGPDGSGGNTTWAGFVAADKKRYGVVQTDARSGERALGAVADGSDVTCMLVVTALGGSLLKQAAQNYGDKVVLVGTDDRDMAKTVDAKGRSIYEYGEIPADTYPKVQPGGTLYGTKSVPTVQVDAVFVSRIDWINANGKAYDKVLEAFRSSLPDIATLAQPKT